MTRVREYKKIKDQLGECSKINKQATGYKKYVEENLKQKIKKAEHDFLERQSHLYQVKHDSREVFLERKLKKSVGAIESLWDEILVMETEGYNEKNYLDLTQRIQDIADYLRLVGEQEMVGNHTPARAQTHTN